uniref:Uncharacterized protein n=1 Tax=Plectus sambesii TaxID=2011161 RepID=A0A914VD90_9BILA
MTWRRTPDRGANAGRPRRDLVDATDTDVLTRREQTALHCGGASKAGASRRRSAFSASRAQKPLRDKRMLRISRARIAGSPSVPADSAVDARHLSARRQTSPNFPR